jgi:hypothetical protein
VHYFTVHTKQGGLQYGCWSNTWDTANSGTTKEGNLTRGTNLMHKFIYYLNTLRTGDADLRFYITTVRDGWRKSAFLTRAWCPRTIHLIMQYREPLLERLCWRMFIETWPHSEWMLCDKYWEQTALCYVQAFLGVQCAFRLRQLCSHDGKS